MKLLLRLSCTCRIVIVLRSRRFGSFLCYTNNKILSCYNCCRKVEGQSVRMYRRYLSEIPYCTCDSLLPFKAACIRAYISEARRWCVFSFIKLFSLVWVIDFFQPQLCFKIFLILSSSFNWQVFSLIPNAVSVWMMHSRPRLRIAPWVWLIAILGHFI